MENLTERATDMIKQNPEMAINIAILLIILIYLIKKVFLAPKMPDIKDLSLQKDDENPNEEEEEDEDQATGFATGDVLTNVKDIIAAVKVQKRVGGLNSAYKTKEIIKDIYPTINLTKNGAIVTPHETINTSAAQKNSGFVLSELVAHGYLEPGSRKVHHPNPRALAYRNPRKRKQVLNGEMITDKNAQEYIDYINSLPENTVFAGNLTGSHMLPEGDQAIINLIENPHFVIVGATSSGKSKTAMNICAGIALSKYNKEAVFYYADGKGSPDYDDLAKKTSPFPVAKPSVSEDPMIEFAQIITAVGNEYKRRRSYLWPELNKKLGKNLSSYDEIETEMRKQDPDFTIPRIVLMIDEYKLWVNLMGKDNFASAQKDDGLIATLISLLAGARSYKFTIILASQELRKETFLPTMKAQMKNRLIHTVTSEGEARYMEVDFEAIKTFKSGDFILNGDKFCQETKDKNITARLPFVGKAPVIYEYIQKRDFAGEREFEKHFLYSGGAGDKEIDKLSNIKFVAMIRDVFFKREGWELVEENDSDHSYIPCVFKKDGNQLAVGIIQKNEATDEEVIDRINTAFPHLKTVQKVFFVRASASGKAKESFKKTLGAMGDIVLTEEDYTRILQEAKKLYITEDKTPIFEPRVLEYKVQKKAKAAQEIEAKLGSGTIKLSVDELKRIANMKGKSQTEKECKGQAFEDFVHALYRAHGWTTFTIEQLLDGPEGYYLRTSQGDKGLDGLFFPPEAGEVKDLRKITPEQSKMRVAVQMKNYAKGLGPGEAQVAISRTHMAKNNYKCLVTGGPIKRGVVIQSADYWSVAAREEAANVDIELLGYTDIIRMINSLHEEAEIKIDIKTETQKMLGEGYKQVDIAKKLGVSRQYVSKIKRQLAVDKKAKTG